MTLPEDGIEPERRTWRRILCATDFSDASREALAIAADLARSVGAELTIAHVTDGAGGPARRELERSLARAKLEAEAYTDAPIRTTLLDGAGPAEEILAFARAAGFDLLVAGTHGRSGVQRLVLGSVAGKLVNRAPCPVLVARAPASARDDVGELDGG